MKKNILFKFIKVLSLFLILFHLCSEGIFAQRIININDESSGLRSSQLLAPQQRTFESNSQLKSLTKENEGDILLLDFFEDKQYRALIKKVTRNKNGIIGITAKVEDTDFGYCYLSVSDKGILINTELPEKDEFYIATSRLSDGYLSAHKMKELMKNKPQCAPLSPPKQIEPLSSAQMQLKNTTANENTPATINVLVVYTKDAKEYIENNLKSSIDLEIDLAIQRANEASANSNLGVDFSLVHSYQTDYQELNDTTDLNNLTNPDDGELDEVHALRRLHKADLVVFTPKVDYTGGVAWRLSNPNGSPAYAFTLLQIQNLSHSYTMVHEMAHNLGCAHHKDQLANAGPGLYLYSSGWKGVINGENKCSIMTYDNPRYWNDNSSYIKIPYFSSPDITYPGTNVPIGDNNTADNARTIRQTKHIVASYKEIINHTILTDLKVNGTTIEGFDIDKSNYTLTIEDETVTIEGITTDYATVHGNVTNAALNYGENIFPLSAVSGNSTFTKKYNIIINRVVSACDSYPSHPSFDGDVSAMFGDDSLNLNMGPEAPVMGNNLLSLNLAYCSSPIYMRDSIHSTNCHSLANGNSFYVYLSTSKIKVTQDGKYTFTANYPLVLTLFDSDTTSHSSFINSSAYWAGNGTSTYYSKRVTASLKANTTYYIKAIYYTPPNTQLSISINGPGICYPELAIPPGTSYTYIAVDQSDNLVKMQSATADFRFLNIGSYSIYGIPYSYGSDPSTFIGKTVSEIQVSDCIIPSISSINMTVTDEVPFERIMGELEKDNPQVNKLRAWKENGLLYVSGLTTGKSWYVYNSSGILIRRDIAKNKEVSISLPAQGIYIIKCENNIIKVVY
ncbi:hypothetical protein M2459_003048 [Parabacteroides sp. PF5-5]|uniref:M12 family metallo-peptidase n=1 Tax=unclassified Parabacteroides TaxID=2649774 RepID=UPI0024751830|nr:MULTISPECIES: M12 family metallo-peptidase [unclassified Parabacteroides]MDH6305837.1 hypothetical protein [Parabacteroides sp. PH5-39]MDH6317349.1 hypothetical protein [Parabacteroides sp. PF5-13]MDH6320557.1 hypothetical protein [Parabacteroides sp. PH5-13]MDH6324280.1 hypothetical protein [Parabacteroides sp. PH5-8]MDH6328477.1 hypothetical protein [Parabacteroides sp. PH5-41]